MVQCRYAMENMEIFTVDSERNYLRNGDLGII